MVAGAPARAARPDRLAVHGLVGVRRVAGAARRARRAGERARGSRRFGEREVAWIDDWERFAGPGAVEDQVRFDREWSALRAYAASRGVRLIGDLPIYVAPGSADHLAHPELFQRGVVAGAPPDALSAAGQLWGNPLYDWAAVRRRRATAGGSSACGGRLRCSTCPASTTSAASSRTGPCAAGERTAQVGRWRRGPGAALFRAIERAARAAAADRRGPGGDHTGRRGSARRARASRDGRAPVRAPAAGRRNPHRPENHRREPRRLHGHARHADRARLVGVAPPRRRARTGLDPAEPHWSLIRLALASPAAISIVPAQDVLGLDNAARMNWPGTTDPRNWTWRLEPGQLTASLAARLREETLAARRTRAVNVRPAAVVAGRRRDPGDRHVVHHRPRLSLRPRARRVRVRAAAPDPRAADEVLSPAGGRSGRRRVRRRGRSLSSPGEFALVRRLRTPLAAAAPLLCRRFAHSATIPCASAFRDCPSRRRPPRRAAASAAAARSRAWRRSTSCSAGRDRSGIRRGRSRSSPAGPSTRRSWTGSSDSGFVVLGGPLADEHRVVMAVEAESDGRRPRHARARPVARDAPQGRHGRALDDPPPRRLSDTVLLS